MRVHFETLLVCLFVLFTHYYTFCCKFNLFIVNHSYCVLQLFVGRLRFSNYCLAFTGFVSYVSIRRIIPEVKIICLQIKYFSVSLN